MLFFVAICKSLTIDKQKKNTLTQDGIYSNAKVLKSSLIKFKYILNINNFNCF